MKQFVYTVKDPLGLHARPAAMVAKLAKAYPNTVITVSCGEKTARADARMKLAGLDARAGHGVTVMAEGVDEDAAIIAISNFFQNHL